MSDLNESVSTTPNMQSHSCCCCGGDGDVVGEGLIRHRKRTPEETRALINRLSRIEGQVRGIRNMLESDAYCTDILIQVSAATSALNGFGRELLSQHVRTCVANDLRDGSEEKLDELLKVLPKLMK